MTLVIAIGFAAWLATNVQPVQPAEPARPRVSHHL